MTYFLHLAISFWYSSATTQYQNLGQYIPYTLENQIITQLPSDIHLKSVKLSINLAQYKKQYSPSQDAIMTASSRPQTSQNFSLCTAHTHFSSISIGCHVPPTNFSACSLVLKFSDSLYIHCNYLFFHILHLLISHASR